MLMRRWLILVISIILGAIIGITYSVFRKPTYTAVCTFVLEEQGGVGGALGQYAGLASMVGIDVGGGSNGLFQGDNIIELYRSRRMIEKTLLSKVNIGRKECLLIDRYISFNELHKKWNKEPQLKQLSFDIPRERFTVKHDSIIAVIVNDINRRCLSVQRPDKKLNIISVQVQSKDELFSKCFTDAIVKNVNAFYSETKAKKAVDNLRILQRQADSVKLVLNSSISKAAIATDANPNANPALRILAVPSQRNQVDIQSASAIYGEVVKNLELAKIALRKDMPLIQIIDEPVLPLKNDKSSTILSGIIGAVMLLFATAVLLLLITVWKNMK